MRFFNKTPTTHRVCTDLTYKINTHCNYLNLNELFQATKGKSPIHLSKPLAFIIQIDIFYFEI